MSKSKIAKFDQEENNPCLKEYNLSFKCLDDNNFNKEKCKVYFENYRNCKDFWMAVKKDRRQNRIYPLLPTKNEREKIKEEYLKNKFK